LERISCVALKAVQKKDEEAKCPYSSVCDGSICINFELIPEPEFTRDKKKLDKILESSTPPNGSQRFYSRLEKTAGILGIETDQRI
jgi:hypothetical protein